MSNYEKRYQVFVSSTYTDLIEERKEATQAILKCNCFPSGMELFPASNNKQWNVIKQVIDDSDFYLLILAGRYGSIGIDDSGNKLGYTEMEFNYAISKGKPIIAMIYRHPENLLAKYTEKTERSIRRLNKFREKAMKGRMVAFWENKDQLGGEIFRSLNEMKSTTPEAIGWIRADVVSQLNNTCLKPSSIIEGFKKFDDPIEKIKFLEAIELSDLIKCFESYEFVDEFIKLINIFQSIKVVNKAIDLIPRLEFKIKEYLRESIDINSLFYSQCKNETFLKTDLSNSILNLLRKLDIHMYEYSMPIFNSLKTSSLPAEHKQKCILHLLNESSDYLPSSKFSTELFKYLLDEFKTENKSLPTKDLTDLFVAFCDGEYGFIQIYNVFIKHDIIIQKDIVQSMLIFCSDLQITNPKIQRMFIEMCDKIFLSNDDEIITELLLFCLYFKTSDIFTIDEIYNKLDEFNDDVFFMFFWRLGDWEYECLSKNSFKIDDIEFIRISEIIKKRNHSRGIKLLEHLAMFKA